MTTRVHLVADLWVTNAIVVTPEGPGPLAGPEAGRLTVIRDGVVAVHDGRITAVGPRDRMQGVERLPGCLELDAGGRVVTPGLVDSHTHLVFGGDRAAEFELRAKGATYAEVLAAGGGIHSSVVATRAATEAELAHATRRRLDAMLACGTTTCEAKSGYGLDLETELRQLRVARDVDHPVERIGTFLGAHAVPRGRSAMATTPGDPPRDWDADGYIDWIIAVALPRIAAENARPTPGSPRAAARGPLARFCDVFCEVGVFTPQQSERLLLAAKAHGLTPKLHADELNDTGGAALAARVGAVSADHLHCASDEGLRAMAAAGTVATLLPGTAVFLGMKDHAPARRMVELGVPVALATDLNPGSCFSESLPLMMSFAGPQLGLTPSEALVACTLNGACAVGEGDRLGSLEAGKQADLVVWDTDDHRHLAYHMGVNLAQVVVKAGQVVLDRRLREPAKIP